MEGGIPHSLIVVSLVLIHFVSVCESFFVKRIPNGQVSICSHSDRDRINRLLQEKMYQIDRMIDKHKDPIDPLQV